MNYLIAGVIALVVGAPPAQASERRVVAESLEAAREFWQVDLPCVRVHPVSSAALRAATGGVSVVGLNAGCEVWIARELLRGGAEYRLMACGSIVHEYGHAMGRLHSRDPRSVMFAGRPQHAVVWGCWRRFMAAARARAWRAMLGRGPRWLLR